jgi:hypothetical protein
MSGEDRLRTSAENRGIVEEFQQGGAESGAVGLKIGDCDPRLTAVVDAWPALPEVTKEQVAALIKAACIPSH